MPQYTNSSTGLIWNYTLDSSNNATIGDGTYNSGNATTRGASLSGVITIPKKVDGYTVTTIGQNAFYKCTNLTSIDLSGTQVETIGQYAFYQCSGLTSLDLSGTQVTTIDYGAFYLCTGLISIDLGNSVTTIGRYAFYNCTGLTSIIIPDSVTTIGSTAFTKCSSLTTITVDASNNSFSDTNGVLFNKEQSILIQYPVGKTATSYAIPNSVTTIGEYAFKYFSNLTSIHIPDSVTTIGEDAFGYCSSLTSIHLGNSLTTIGKYAFSNCTGLNSLDLSGAQVETIGRNAFQQTGLTSIDLGNSVTTIGWFVFYKCSSLTSITFPTNVNFTTIDDYTFRECSSLTSITIPDSVTSIGQQAFYNCTSLTSITIPDSVTTIDSSAFNGIGSPSTVFVKNVDPTDAYTKTTLQNTMGNNISGNVTYEQWVDPNANANAAPGTPTVSDISCNENTPYNATVSATDDNGDALTFSLSGADSADFTLTGTSLSANAVFDFETKATYNITITASDGTDSTSADFTITVNNVVETASELFNANVQGTELKTSADDAGYTIEQLLAAGYTIEQLVAAGFQIWNYTLDANNNATIGDDTGVSGNATTLGTSLSGAITIPSTVDGHTVIGIGQYAFFQSSGLTSIDLSGTQVETIDQVAFSNCSSLTSVDLGNSVTSIGQYAFSYCTKLTSITIPDSVQPLTQVPSWVSV